MEETFPFPKERETEILLTGATYGENVEIGHGAVIGKNVIIGEGTKIGAYVTINGWTTIGNNCIIHPHVSIASEPHKNKHGEKGSVIVGDNTQIREFVTINGSIGTDSKTQIGSHCLLSAYSHIDPNCIVGNYVVMSNAVNLAAHVEVEDRAVIGGLTIIHQFTKIGKNAMVGGASKVIQDVPPFTMVNGNPAKAFGINTIGMKRVGINENKRRTLKNAYKILYLSGLGYSRALEVMEEQLILCEELEYFMNFLRGNRKEICRVAHKSKTSLKQVN